MLSVTLLGFLSHLFLCLYIVVGEQTLAWEHKTDKTRYRSVKSVTGAAACEINMISKASMFIYWKYLDEMQEAAKGSAERGSLVFAGGPQAGWPLVHR